MAHTSSRRTLFSSVLKKAFPFSGEKPFNTVHQSIYDQQDLLKLVFRPKDNTNWRVRGEQLEVSLGEQRLFAEKLTPAQLLVFKQLNGRVTLDQLCQLASQDSGQSKADIDREIIEIIIQAANRGIIESCA